MTTVEKHEPGTFCWVELSTTDLGAGIDFYTKLFGWRASTNPIEGWGEYATFTVADGRGAAGGYVQQEQERSMGVPPHWNLYLYTDDVDKTVAKATELGAKAFVPGADTPMGRMAVMADPTGAMVSLWQSDRMPGWKVRDEHGSFSWPELITPQTDQAARFYDDLFGWTTQVTPTEGPAGPYTIFSKDGKQVAGMMKPPGPDIPPNWLPYFEVSDAESAVETAGESGAHVEMEPMAIPDVGTFAVLVDPQGATFAVIQSERAPE